MSIFKTIGLPQELVTAIDHLGFTEPTKIQEKTIPPIMEGRDVMGESATGSGKTLAFGCGIVKHVTPGKGLQALIMAPTRELAEQVKGVLTGLGSGKKLKIISVYGGVAIGPQISELRRADVVVGTPGRLLDHMERDTIDLSRVAILVLDEADRMLDMGFIEDVEKIMSVCPKKRQTLFFSATLDPQIQTLGKRYMRDPVTVNASQHVDPSKLKQVYYDVQHNMKLSLLAHLLREENSGLVMVFCNTRRQTEFVAKNLRSNKVDATAIHGGFSQNKRTKSMDNFNTAKAGILVCTDVAARGLHINNVSHVYNYEIPKEPKDYVHRIGRTARAGESGKVINLISDFDHDNFSRLMRDYRDFKIERIEKPYVERVVAIKNGEARGGFRGGYRGSKSGGRVHRQRRQSR